MCVLWLCLAWWMKHVWGHKCLFSFNIFVWYSLVVVMGLYKNTLTSLRNNRIKQTFFFIISFVVFLNNHLINSSQRATNWTPWLVVGPPGLKLQATFFGAPNLPNSNAFYFLYHKLYKFAILRHMKWLGFLWYHSNHIPTNNKEKKGSMGTDYCNTNTEYSHPSMVFHFSQNTNKKW